MPDEQQPAFSGFELPEQNWFRLPNSWTDITSDIKSLAELKVVEYVLRHTWGYREFGMAKCISIDEFMKGRRRKDGSRMDRGTGLSNRSVIDGLRNAVSHGYLVEEIDDSDRGRVKKRYYLRMRPSATVTGRQMVAGTDPTGQSGTSGPIGKHLPPGVKNLHRGVENLHPSGKEASPRSEKDTSGRQKTVTVNGDERHDVTADVHPVTQLPSLELPHEQVELLADDMAEQLGDRGSLRFYLLVADRVPEQTIRRHLAEIKAGGAKHPPKLFNHRIRRHAERRLASVRAEAISRFKKNWPSKRIQDTSPAPQKPA